jgi:hypothetical protein
LEGCFVKARDFLKPALDVCEDLEASLDEAFGLEGMAEGKPWQARDGFVHTGVIFHRAGAQGIKAVVNSIVPVAQVGEVAYHFQLAYFGEFGLFSDVFFADEVLEGLDRYIAGRRKDSGATGL